MEIWDTPQEKQIAVSWAAQELALTSVHVSINWSFAAANCAAASGCVRSDPAVHINWHVFIVVNDENTSYTATLRYDGVIDDRVVMYHEIYSGKYSEFQSLAVEVEFAMARIARHVRLMLEQ